MSSAKWRPFCFGLNVLMKGSTAFTVFNHADSNGMGGASRAQRPLTTGIVRWQFPSIKDTTWRNNGRSARTGSLNEHMYAFYMEITNIHGVKLKMSCFNRDEDRSVGVCCPNALRLVRTGRQTTPNQNRS